MLKKFNRTLGFYFLKNLNSDFLGLKKKQKTGFFKAMSNSPGHNTTGESETDKMIMEIISKGGIKNKISNLSDVTSYC